MVIRRVRATDAPALLAFYRGLSAESLRTFRPLGPSPALNPFLQIVRDNEPQVDAKFDLVALDSEVCGWSFLWDLKSGTPTFGLAVADARHGRGIGGRLMDLVLSAARERKLHRVELIVVQGNATALAMYERRGFVRTGEFKGEDGLDYFRMAADLTTPRDGAQ